MHMPALHVEPAPQRVPHMPQLRGSVCVLVHVVPPHIVMPVPHTHTPETHDAPMPHARPHAPQLLASLETSAQPPFMQRIAPAPHVHMPIAHVPPGPHETAQEPQCAGSVASEAQVVPQATWPAGHMHAPIAQGVPAGHAWPHIPQFDVLLCRSTQLPLHTVFGAMQLPLHVPDVQLWPGAHARLQPPQLAGSAARSTHAPPQTTSAAGHMPSVGALSMRIALSSVPPPPSSGELDPLHPPAATRATRSEPAQRVYVFMEYLRAPSLTKCRPARQHGRRRTRAR
jgi:hypothetical protein